MVFGIDDEDDARAILERPSVSKGELDRLVRIADNANAQVQFMCTEIAKALGLPKQSPAGTVQSVRDLAKSAGV